MPYKNPKSPEAIASRKRVNARRWQKIKNNQELLEKKRKTDREFVAAHVEEAAARFAAWAPQNRDKLRANSARYVERYPARVDVAAQKYHLMKHYGLTIGQFDNMLIEQSGRCGLCNDPMVRPCIDHDHVNGILRELICFSCNVALGHLNDDPIRCELAALYLRKHKG